MARRRRTQKGQVWYRKFNDTWYATIDGKKVGMKGLDGRPIKGQSNKEEAEKALARHKLGIESNKRTSDHLTVGDVLENYLQKLKRDDSPTTYANTKYFMDDLHRYAGGLAAKDFRKKHVEKWIENHPGWKSANTKRGIIAMVKAAFNLALADDDIPLDSDPIAKLERPKGFGRITWFEEDDEREVLDFYNQPAGLKCVSLAPIGEFFFACLHTGARPGELAIVTKHDVIETERGLVLQLEAQDDDGGFRHKTGKKTGRTRRILCNGEVATLIRKLVMKAEDGEPLFKTPRGRQWKRVNWVQHFCTLREKLAWENDKRKSKLSFYSCRHTFAKRILNGYYGERGDIYVVAGLLGNTVKVCEEHYAQWVDAYSDPLWTAIGSQSKRQVG